MTVSLCIVAYNEHSALPSLFKDILSQTYDPGLVELVFADSASTDDTRELFAGFREKYRERYLDILLVDNPRKKQAAGWNEAIRASSGDIIIRLDAHASIPADFIEKNVRLIESGEYVCGGARPNNIESPTPYREMLLLAESSMFGSSFAGYRREGEGKKYVSSLFHGAYRREVFARAGGFDVSLGRTEDNELHYRIRQNGFRICQSSDIISYQNIRPTLRKMLSQKFGNGLWIGLTLGKCPGCLSVFHFAPFCFVTALAASLVCAAVSAATASFWLLMPLLIVGGAYLAADLLMSGAAFISAEKKNAFMLLLPFIFPLLHIVYGAGTVTGLVRLPFWKRSLDGSEIREIGEVAKAAGEKMKNKNV